MSYSSLNILRLPNLIISPDTYTANHLGKVISFANYNSNSAAYSTYAGEKANCISIEAITNSTITTTKTILVRTKLTTLLTAASSQYVDWAIYNAANNQALGIHGKNGFFYNTNNKLSTLYFGNYEAMAIIPANTSFYIKCFNASSTTGASLDASGSNVIFFQLEL